jgi:hypothetical protein
MRVVVVHGLISKNKSPSVSNKSRIRNSNGFRKMKNKDLIISIQRNKKKAQKSCETIPLTLGEHKNFPCLKKLYKYFR